MEGQHLSLNAHEQDHRDILAGESEMARLIRSARWSETPLGPPESWSQSLRTSLSICLNSRFPILIWWGPELIMLYNDAYRVILGPIKHPRALGQRGRECFPEIWNIIGPMLEGVLTRGEATWSEDQLLLLDRSGFPEECYFTFSYSPIHDGVPIADGTTIGGVFTAVTETTGRVVSERRMRVLADLSTHVSGAETEERICGLAMRILAENRQDLPFAALYLFDPAGTNALRVGQTGLAGYAPALPAFLEPAARERASNGVWPFPRVLSPEQFTPDDSLYRLFGLDPGDPGIQPVTRMEVLTLGAPDAPLGFLVAGLSPYRPLDDDYRNFLSLAAGQIASALAAARALEGERKRAEALAELDRAKTEFFSNVSHEFRTPLTLMLDPLQEVLNDSGADLSPQNRAHLELAQRSSLRLLKLVNTLLDFSRIESGRARAAFQPVDLSAATADLASVFRSAIEQANLRLVVDCPPLPEPVYVDQEMWEKIVLNLVSNAFKFTFEGQIGVSIAWLGQRVELRVTDTGVGIAAEELPLIFDRFHRVPGARARSLEGSGIGLALVRELVELHGGTVTVASQPGRGSTFCVSLPTGSAHLPPKQIRPAAGAVENRLGPRPFVEEARRWLPGPSAAPQETGPALAEPPRPAGEAEESAAPATILLADDNADMREYLRRLLSARWRVQAVADGQAAFAAARSLRPDLLLADVMMPGMDGFELLRRLRADPTTRDLPIILVSARAGEEARVEGLDRGADDYLIKPFSARELIARVEARLELVKMRREMAEALRQSERRYLEKMAQLEVQRHMLEYREKERLQIARDIHDGPIQSLVGAIFNMQFVKETVQDALLQSELDKFGQSLKRVVQELREVVNDLRPPAVIKFGLTKAIRINAIDFQEKHPEYQVTLELQDDEAQLPEPVCLALYRVYQEELNNIVRHAEATQIWVRYSLTAGAVTFEVQDNGKGFPSPENLTDLTLKGHYGLAGMKERVDAVRGQLEIQSAPGQGTTLRITIPRG